MSARFEQSIIDWYNKSKTANLEYLDLANTSKITLRELSNNQDVIFDRISLFSRVSLRNFKAIQEKQQELDSRLAKVEQGVKELSRLFAENRPLTKGEVHQLVKEIAQQPKKVEEEALNLLSELQKKINLVEAVVHKVERALA